MNKQGKLVKSSGVVKVVGGIEWTKTVLPDGNERQGYTWNPVAGCRHACRWQMPDGTVAECYAKGVAEGVASPSYPGGFEAHYWHPGRLSEPLTLRKPARIFLDSMSDLMGHWVPDEQIQTVLDIVAGASWHTFQLLTKNPARLPRFTYPPNLWVGVSSPPDSMWGSRIEPRVQERMLNKTLGILEQLDAPVKWMSFEPLSWDVSETVDRYSPVLDWAVIGAATNGAKAHQPHPLHVRSLLDVLDEYHVRVFFKGNLDWKPWREEFPGAR